MENGKGNAANHKGGRKYPITPERDTIIHDTLAEGKTYLEAYTKAGISKSTFFKYLESDKNLKDAVKKAEQDFHEYFDKHAVRLCKRSLTELITGYEYDEVTTESYIDPKTQKTVKKEKVAHKKVGPNITAVIFTLCNRDPDNWKNRITNDVNGHLETETNVNIPGLSKLSDETLAKVIDEINAKE